MSYHFDTLFNACTSPAMLIYDEIFKRAFREDETVSLVKLAKFVSSKAQWEVFSNFNFVFSLSKRMHFRTERTISKVSTGKERFQMFVFYFTLRFSVL